MDRRKLLIADDSEMNRAMLANMLDHDFQIIEAVDGHETISALEMYEGEIAALLLDIVMPEMDGFQVLEEMQRRGWTESVPTIMISAETGSAYIDRAFELGASDYINRPFTTGIIRRRIINAILLHTKKQQLIDIVSNYSYRHEKNTEEMVSILSSAVEHRLLRRRTPHGRRRLPDGSAAALPAGAGGCTPAGPRRCGSGLHGRQPPRHRQAHDPP